MSLTKATYSMIEGAPANVLDYGADPTGVADSAAAFIAANADGRSIYVPAGNFKLSSAVTLTQSIVGEGRASRILLADPAAQLIVDVDNASVRDLTILANATMTVAAIEIINYRAFWDVSNIFCFNGSGTLYDGVKIASGLSGMIQQCRVSDASNIGIHITYPSAGNYANGITVLNCQVRNSGVADIKYHRGVNGLIMGCVCEGTGPLRYLIQDASAMVSGCYAEGNGGSGTTSISYKLDNANSCVVSSNSSHAAKTFWLTGNSSNNWINGTGFDTNASIYEVDAGCLDNSIFWGGYVPQAKITDNGTRTTIFVNGGFGKGSATDPGISFTTDPTTSPNTGFSCTSTRIYSIINGVELTRVESAPSADQTAFWALTNIGGVLSMKKFLLGAADSGGAGYRMVRVTN